MRVSTSNLSAIGTGAAVAAWAQKAASGSAGSVKATVGPTACARAGRRTTARARGRTTLRRTTAPPPASSAEPRDAKAIEHAVRAVDGLHPVEVGREVRDQGLDVDAVRGGAVVLERDQRLREEVDGTACGAPAGAQVERGGELHEGFQEGALLGRRRPPRLLPRLLRAQVAAAVEEAHAAAEGVPRDHARDEIMRRGSVGVLRAASASSRTRRARG